MDKREQAKIIVLSAMHGRQATVSYCLDMMPGSVDVYMGYSDHADGEFLRSTRVKSMFQFPNDPLSDKWNSCAKTIKNVDFDAVILVGSDDWFDDAFLDFIHSKIGTFDLLGFTDLYFEQGWDMYYWSGHDGKRKGEPAGAGKVYSKQFLERINYSLFPFSSNHSLDGMSWRKCKAHNANIQTYSLKENRLKLIDVKDGQGLTPLKSITNLTAII